MLASKTKSFERLVVEFNKIANLYYFYIYIIIFVFQLKAELGEYKRLNIKLQEKLVENGTTQPAWPVIFPNQNGLSAHDLLVRTMPNSMEPILDGVSIFIVYWIQNQNAGIFLVFSTQFSIQST